MRGPAPLGRLEYRPSGRACWRHRLFAESITCDVGCNVLPCFTLVHRPSTRSFFCRLPRGSEKTLESMNGLSKI
jgi:hypothetical protein